MVTSFKYQGIVISVADDECPAVVQNLAKTRTVWWRTERILSREGVRLRLSVFFFKAVFQ